MDYRSRVLAANAIASVLIMTAARCAQTAAEQSQLTATRANAAADRAEASARAAEKAAHDATVATDRVEKVVRGDSKVQRRRRHHRLGLVSSYYNKTLPRPGNSGSSFYLGRQSFSSGRREGSGGRRPMNVSLKPAPEMRSRLLAIIEPENAFNFAVQFVGQTNRPSAAAIEAALMFEPIKINSERAVELRNGAGENYGPPCGTFLYNRDAVRTGKFLYLLDIARVGSELLREILALDVLR
jgi:hypothetical protein